MAPEPSVQTQADELAAERRYVVYARECLRIKREDVDTLIRETATKLGDEVLLATLTRRAASLADDDGSSPLFFGRIDGPEPHPLYIGRRHISDRAGDPVVIDWRARIATVFYQARHEEPLGVTLRRRFGYSAESELTSYEDEVLEQAPTTSGLSDLVRQEVERAHLGPMRDIVATIQPDQDRIVRGSLSKTVIIQGGPGTGKTAVGLHRAAYLLFENPKLRDNGVLIIGPSNLFIQYINRVLPALGETRVEHATLTEVIGGVASGTDSPEQALLKADARMAGVIRNAVYQDSRLPTDDLVIDDAGPRVRVEVDVLRRLANDLTERGVRFHLAREQFAERLLDHIQRDLERRGRVADPAALRRLRKAKPVRTLAEAIWPKLKPEKVLYRLLSEPESLATAARGVLTEDEQATLRWQRLPPRPPRTPWSPADLFLLDEVNAHLERPRTYGHLVIDEAQDLSAMQARALRRRCVNSATVLGDMAQRTQPWALGSWDALSACLQLDSHLLTLDTSYRVPGQILAVANRLLPAIAPDLAPTRSGRSQRGAVRISHTTDIHTALIEEIGLLQGQPGSIGIVVSDHDTTAVAHHLDQAGLTAVPPSDVTAEHRVALIPASIAKGLEFDHVIVLEPASILRMGDHGLRLLYIALTRAISQLVIVHHEALPEQLAGPAL